MTNLKQIMLAIHNYHDANGYLPADIRDKNDKVVLSWRVAILPYLMEDNLYKQFKLGEPWDSEHNLKMLKQMPATYRVGFEPKDSTHTYYMAFAGLNTPLAPTAGTRGTGAVDSTPDGRAIRSAGPRIRLADITDGTPNTLGIAELGPPVPWTKPADIPFDPKKPVKLVTPFSNEWHAAMMDGSAHALKRDIDPDVLRRLIIMNDGEQRPLLDPLRPPPWPPAETEAEKRELREKTEENQVLIDRIRALMKEQGDLLALQNRLAENLDRAEDTGYWVRKILDELKPRNKVFRDNLGLPPGKPVPKPNEP